MPGFIFRKESTSAGLRLASFSISTTGRCGSETAAATAALISSPPPCEQGAIKKRLNITEEQLIVDFSFNLNDRLYVRTLLRTEWLRQAVIKMCRVATSLSEFGGCPG